MNKLTKLDVADLIDAVNYMKLTDWTKYKEDGNRSGDRISQDEARVRFANLLTKLHDIKSEEYIPERTERQWNRVDENI